MQLIPTRTKASLCVSDYGQDNQKLYHQNHLPNTPVEQKDVQQIGKANRPLTLALILTNLEPSE
jgi:hypothetical protein